MCIILFILFLERGREGEREGEKHQGVVASHVAPTGDLACNPGMCPDWESNRRPFGLQPTLIPQSYTSQGPHCGLNLQFPVVHDDVPVFTCLFTIEINTYIHIFFTVVFCKFLFKKDVHNLFLERGEGGGEEGEIYC